MIIYILKTVLCSAFLLLFYFLFLEKEKMHRFNRFYLLFSLIISFVIPFISFTTTLKNEVLPIEQLLFLPQNNIQQIATQQKISPMEEYNYLPFLVWGIYLCVTLFLLFRFSKNILTLYYKVKNNKTVSQSNATFVLTRVNLTAHSFLHYIFINKIDFENAAIEKEILHHELTHVKQNHSLDILLVEILLIVFWFNPFLYLYRKAIALNHEFLADDEVIRSFNNTTAYQYLLLEKSSQQSSLSFTSQFNYLITKKRLLMLTKKTPPRIALLKQLALLPLLAIAVFIFSTKSFAQQTPSVIKDAAKAPPSTITGASLEMMTEYENIISKYKGTDKRWMITFSQKITAAEKERLKTIFIQMSKEQQENQNVRFVYGLGRVLPKATPAKAQFESFKNAGVYGVWINDKKVNNAALNKYSNTDFEHFFVSKLYGAAKKDKLYTHQLNLMTTDYYADYCKKTTAAKNTLFMNVGSFVRTGN